MRTVIRLASDSAVPVDYLEATDEEAKWRLMADEASSRRAEALDRMHQSGMSYGQIAKTTGLSRSRVQQLVKRGSVLSTNSQ